MMKKKVKKIPKYNGGTPNATPFYENANFYSAAGDFLTQQVGNVQQSKQGVTGLGIAKGTLGGAAAGAGIGTMIAPGIGTAIGAAGGALVGGITSAIGHQASADVKSNSTNFDDIFTPESGISGWFHDDEDDRQQAYRIQNSNYSKLRTEQIRHKYATKGIAPNPNIFAAEGGIMRKPVDALVSRGELIYNPTTKKLSKVPGSNGKPNKKDDVYARLNEGDMVISNSPTMVMANGKTPAQNLEGLVDSNKNIKAKEAIIKKVVNWQEANKTKPNDLHKYALGEDEVLDVPITPVEINPKPRRSKLEEELYKPQTPEITGKDRRWIYHASKALNTLSDYVPLASALLGKYDYHTEHAYINPALYVPTTVTIDPIRRATDEGMAIARYNQMTSNTNTGAGLAHGLQAAANRSKSLADAYKWQQDAQNKLIALNVGIYNDWAAREAQARHLANTETRQNEAAAQMMRDQAIKDAYEFQTGRRNDRWKLSMLEPMFQYAVDDKIWKSIKI